MLMVNLQQFDLRIKNEQIFCREICILDPNWTSKTFPKWEKEGLVRTEGTLVYTSPEVLHQEVKKLGDPSYTIFRRKKG